MIDSEKRETIIGLARGKYIETGATRNITEALRMYLENDAGPDEQIPLFITTPEISRIKSLLKTIRPECEECGEALRMQIKGRDPEGQQYPTAWICNGCGLVEYSDKTPEEWIEILSNEDRK